MHKTVQVKLPYSDFTTLVKDDFVELIFEKYGWEQCAVVGGFSTFQARSAFAEVAKVLGVAEREVRKFTKHFLWGFGGGWVPDEKAPKGGDGLIELLRARLRPVICRLRRNPTRRRSRWRSAWTGGRVIPRCIPAVWSLPSADA